MNEDVVKAIDATIKVLEKHGWTQRTEHDFKTGKVCLVGAMKRGTWLTIQRRGWWARFMLWNRHEVLTVGEIDSRSETYHRLQYFVLRAIEASNLRLRDIRGHIQRGTIMGWNDSDGRTVAEIMAVLMAARSLADPIPPEPEPEPEPEAEPETTHSNPDWDREAEQPSKTEELVSV